MQETVVQCSLEAYGGEAIKSQVFPNNINGSKRACMLKSQMKTILITFFNIKSSVHFEFISQGQTVNYAYYIEILMWLCETLHSKRPEECWPNNWILHHDNAIVHKTLSVK
jgi:hypothetical protein